MDIQVPTRRVRRCGHCGGAGHDRRTCPDPEQVERRRVNAEARSAARATRSAEAEVEQARPRPRRPPKPGHKYFKSFNNSPFIIYLY